MSKDRIFFGQESSFSLDLYLLSRTLKRDITRPFVLVCPGGGYFFVNPREGESIALALNAVGINAAVLNYTTEEGTRYPTQLKEAAIAMDWIKSNAKNLDANPEFVYMMGFSAGGHLAASVATLWNKEKDIKEFNCRPRAVILAYAVTISGKFENKRTFDNLCGDDAQLRNFTSLADKVDKDTPQFFIWHTYEDELVPVENAIEFSRALRKNDVPFEMHIYQKGPHALSLAKDFTADTDEQINEHVSTWFSLATDWICQDFKK